MNDCEVCKAEPSIGVACVPGLPISVAYGRNCLAANAHPYDLVVWNTASIGGLKDSAEWWKQLVADTCKHLGKTDAEFAAAVVSAEEEINAFEETLNV